MGSHANNPKDKAIPRPASAGFDKESLLHVLVLITVTVIVYLNSLNGKFVFDDQLIVLENPRLMNVHTLGEAFAIGAGWRQLLFLTYGLNFYLSGLDTFSYHAANLLLHLVNVLLVYAIIIALLRDGPRSRFAAFAGAAVFSVHPLFSAAVSYIAGRSSELCGTFYFASILLFLKARDSATRRLGVVYFLSAGIAGVLAWQAKQEAITLPLFLAAIVFLRTEKKNWRWIAALAAIPAATLVLIRDQIRAIYATVGGNHALVSAGFEKVLPAATYFRTYISSVGDYYLPRFLLPVNLSADPQIARVDHWYSPEFLFAVIILGALGWLSAGSYRRAPLLSIGIAAVLVSPITAYAAIPLADVVLEHRAYIPGLGVALVFAWAFQWIARVYPNLRWPAVALVGVAFSVMTVSRNAVYANNIALWEDAVRKAPEKPRPHFNLGQAYQNAQRFADARREYQRALALKSDFHAAYSNIASIDLDQGQLDKAEEVLRQVTSVAPDFSDGFNNLAALYIRTERPDEAIAAADRALQINSDSFGAHFNKAEALTEKGEFKLALENYKRAVYLRPDLVSFKFTLGLAYLRAQDREAALKVFNELTDTSVAPDAYREMGTLYSSDEGHLDKAIFSLEQAVQLRPMFPDAHYDLGVAYLRKRMLDAAIKQFQETLREQQDHGPATLNLARAQQIKGDVAQAKQTLESYLERYGDVDSPFAIQARQRLRSLK